jgi:hypothetical protein
LIFGNFRLGKYLIKEVLQLDHATIEKFLALVAKNLLWWEVWIAFKSSQMQIIFQF